MERGKSGTIGWGLLAGYVLAWDILAPETLSSAADRALEHPAMKYVAYGIGAVTVAHVFNVFDELGLERYDPFLRGFELLDSVRQVTAIEE